MPIDDFDETGYRARLIARGIEASSAATVAARTAEAKKLSVKSTKKTGRTRSAPNPAAADVADAKAPAGISVAGSSVDSPARVKQVNRPENSARTVPPLDAGDESIPRKVSSVKSKTAVAQLVEQAAQLEQQQIFKSTTAAIKGQQQTLFDFAPWSDDMRAMPNDFLRTAVFTTRNKRVPREVRNNYPVFALHLGLEITYTGIELRADDDELVWQQVLEYAKHVVIGTPVSFTFYELCKDLGWSINGRYYDKAEDCLTRLQATAFKFVSNRIGRLDSISLISRFRVLDRGKKSSRCQVEIDDEIVLLFAGQHYSKFQWEKYRALSPTARRLFDYFVSHKDPFGMLLESFRRLCGSDTERVNKWKEQCNKACSELTMSGLVRKTWIDKGLIHCER